MLQRANEPNVLTQTDKLWAPNIDATSQQTKLSKIQLKQNPQAGINALRPSGPPVLSEQGLRRMLNKPSRPLLTLN